MKKRSKFQKVMLLIFAAMLLVFSVLLAITRAHKGVEFEDALLDVTESADKTLYSGTAHGEYVEIAVGRDGATTTVTYRIGARSEDVYTVETGLSAVKTSFNRYLPGVRISRGTEIVFEGGWDADYSDDFFIGGMLYDLNGEPSAELLVEMSAAADGYWDDWQPGLGSVLHFVRGAELTARGDARLFAVAAAMLGMAAVLTAFPTELFRLKYRWDVKDPEPTDFYYGMTYLTAILLACFALAAFIMALRYFPAP